MACIQPSMIGMTDVVKRSDFNHRITFRFLYFHQHQNITSAAIGAYMEIKESQRF